MKVELEVWNSTANRQEKHYFIPDGDRGYQHNTYLFGYNPELVSEELARTFLAMIRAAASI